MRLTTTINGQKYYSSREVTDIISNALNDKTEVHFIRSPEPAYSRQEVLSELWQPKNVDFYAISCGNVITKHPYLVTSELYKESFIISGHVFAPTEELALEIRAVREGKWLPEKGDKFVRAWKNGWTNSDDINTAGYSFGSNNSESYFPSLKQRDTFIAKNKPKEKDSTANINLQFGFSDASIEVALNKLFANCKDTGVLNSNPHPLDKLAFIQQLMLKRDTMDAREAINEAKKVFEEFTPKKG